jgi:hypothetical protein
MNTQQPKASTTTANAEASEEKTFLTEIRKLEDTARLYQSEVILPSLYIENRANMSKQLEFSRSY